MVFALLMVGESGDVVLEAALLMPLFVVTTWLLKHSRLRNVTVEISASGVFVPGLGFEIGESEIASIKRNTAANGAGHLVIQTVSPRFFFRIGSILWVGRYLDVTLGQPVPG